MSPSSVYHHLSFQLFETVFLIFERYFHHDYSPFLYTALLMKDHTFSLSFISGGAGAHVIYFWHVVNTRFRRTYCLTWTLWLWRVLQEYHLNDQLWQGVKPNILCWNVTPPLHFFKNCIGCLHPLCKQSLYKPWIQPTLLCIHHEKLCFSLLKCDSLGHWSQRS